MSPKFTANMLPAGKIAAIRLQLAIGAIGALAIVDAMVANRC